jgi:hypothetical protein
MRVDLFFAATFRPVRARADALRPLACKLPKNAKNHGEGDGVREVDEGHSSRINFDAFPRFLRPG